MYTVLLGMCYLTEKLLYKQLKLNFEHIATFQEVLKNSVLKKKKNTKIKSMYGKTNTML